MKYLAWRIAIVLINLIVFGLIPLILLAFVFVYFNWDTTILAVPLVASLFLGGVHQRFVTGYLDTDLNVFQAMIMGYKDLFAYIKLMFGIQKDK
jgi:hypothetical protein